MELEILKEIGVEATLALAVYLVIYFKMRGLERDVRELRKDLRSIWNKLIGGRDEYRP